MTTADIAEKSESLSVYTALESIVNTSTLASTSAHSPSSDRRSVSTLSAMTLAGVPRHTGTTKDHEKRHVRASVVGKNTDVVMAEHTGGTEAAKMPN